MPDVFVELRATITEFQTKMREARGEMEKTSKEGSGHFAALSKASGAGLLAVGAAAVAIGGFAVEAASKLDDAHVKLGVAVKNTGGNMKALTAPLDAADRKMENLGFTSAQTEEALASGTTALGSSKKAMDILSTAADLAAYKHIDLSSAMVAVAKGTEGNLRPLKQLGIDLPVVASSSEKVVVAQQNLAKAQANVHDLLVKFPNAANPASAAHGQYEKAIGKVSDAQFKLSGLTTAGSDILDGLRKRMGGQASAAADTFAGKLVVAKAKMNDAAAALGAKLIPVVEIIVTKLSDAVTWLSKHKDAMTAMLIAFGGVIAAMIGIWIAGIVAEMTFATAATGGIILLIAGLALAAVYLATHWKQVWGDIKKVFDDAVSFLRTGLGTTLIVLILGPLAPLALLALHWKTVWDGIKTVIHVAVGDLLGFFKKLGDGFFNLIQGILNAGSHLPFVGKYFRQANDAVKQAHQDFDNTMTQWIGDAKTFGDKVGKNTVGGVVAGIQTGTPAANQQAKIAIDQIQKHMRLDGAQSAEVKQVGIDLAAGIGSGLAAGSGAAELQAKINIQRVAHQMKLTAQTGSPSKLTYPIGVSMADGVIAGMESKTVAAMKAASKLITSVGGGIGAGQPTASPGGWAAAGQAMAASMYGWTGAEWVALNNVIMRESGWNPNAQNPTSTAYGIAQNIGGRAGYPDPSPAGQIAWALAYIKSRYGDPIGAWAHELSAGWYDKGGRLPGLSLAYNTTGRDEVIAPGGAHGMTVNVYVGGSVVTEQGIVNAIHSGLLEKQKRVPLGIRAG